MSGSERRAQAGTGQPKILCVGLSKTGNHSLNEALSLLGYSVIHSPAALEDIALFDAAEDLYQIVYERLEELDRAYPGSRYICTDRPIDSWLESCSHWFDEGRRRAKPHEVRRRRAVYGRVYFDERVWRETFDRYHQKLESHFRGQPERLLRMNLSEGDGWEPLCDFLARPVPAEAFPHAYKSRR